MKILRPFFFGLIGCIGFMNGQQKTCINLPCGLINNGAECYMNCVLQCLANLNPVMNYAIDQKPPQKVRISIQKTSQLMGALAKSGKHPAVYQTIVNNNCFDGTTLFMNTLATMHSTSRAYDPALFKAWARNYLFHEMRQQNHDAHEFFTLLFTTLSRTLQHLFTIHIKKLNWYCHTTCTNTMPIMRLFIPSQANRISVCDCLATTLATKYETWHFIQPLPPILTLVLQRIDAYERKNMVPIDVQKHLSIQGKTYELKSIVLHRGNHLEKGHFVALVNNDNDWFLCNDKTIKQCRAGQDVLLQARKLIKGGNTLTPYILFYELES